MKSKVTVASLCAFLSISCVMLAGCSSDREESTNVSLSSQTISSTTTEISSTTTDALSEPNSTFQPSPETVETAPQKGEPTVFVGPDGEIIYSSEVTAIYSSDKKAAELTETDYWTSVSCEGFQYFTLPSGVAYNNYHNPEMFDGIVYCSQAEENKNNCQRLYVGEELCGLKLVSAVSQFNIENYENLSGPCYYDGYCFGPGSERYVAEFEGEIEIVGFLGVNVPGCYEPEGGSLHFTPTESKLPILGNNPEFYEHTNFVGNEYSVYSDMRELGCGYIQELECSSAGLELGDMALVRLTLSNIKYRTSESIIAEIESIELLSDILYHEQGSY